MRKIILLILGFISFSNIFSQRTTVLVSGGSNVQDSLWTFYTSNYAITSRVSPSLAGFTITGVSALATSPVTGNSYCALRLNGFSSPELAQINTTTGVCTAIGSLGDNISSLAFNANGTLFGITDFTATTPYTMYRISLADASKTLLVTLTQVNPLSSEVIAFCPTKNLIYEWQSSFTAGAYVVRTIDTTGTTITTLVNTSGSYTIQGGVYIGINQFLLSNFNNGQFIISDTLGNFSGPLAALPDNQLRGFASKTCTSSIVSNKPTTICNADSVRLTVLGGVSSYQWYQNGTLINGATSVSYYAKTAAVYNCRFTDSCGITDSLPAGISVSVNPVPTVNAVISQTVCNGSSTTAVTFSGSLAGTVFNWTGSNATIGLATSGSGNIASFTGTNTGNAPVIDTITVIPAYTNNGVTCNGTATTFTITVNPIPTVNAVANQTVCNGTNSTAITFSGAVTGTTYSWTGTNSTIGLAVTGTGNIASFSAVNTGANPVIDTITVTPTYGGGFLTNAVPTIILNGNPGCTPIEIGYNPLKNLYYAVGGGSSSCGIMTFDASGNMVFNTINSGHDWRGIWWNPTVDSIEGNPCSTCSALGIREQDLNASGYALGTGRTVLPANQPNFQSQGDLDYINYEIIYYNSGIIYRVSRTTNANLPNVTITGLPVSIANLNTYLIGYSGVIGAEYMVYDYVTKRVYFINRATGAYVGTCQLPGSAPATSSAWDVGFANGQIWIFNGSGWNGYQVANAGNGGGASCTGTSKTFTVTVNPTVVFTTQPANVTACAGANATFTVAATGNPSLTYQWQVSTDGGTTYNNIAGATSASLALTAVTTAQNSNRYRCTVTGYCSSNSNAATLTVNGVSTIAIAPLPTRICIDDTLINLSATPIGGVWSGTGVFGNTFLPYRTAVGNYTLRYTFTNASTCTSSATVTATVISCPERALTLRNNGVTIYPNPNNGRFNIRLNTNLYNYLMVRIFNANGNLVNGNIVGASVTSPTYYNLMFNRVIPIDISYMPAGVYHVNVLYDDGVRTDQATFNIIVVHN